MKTRIRCVVCFILSTFAFLWALGLVCYEWGYFEDFAKVDNWHKFICIYEGLLVLLTIWCFFDHPYYTRKALLSCAICSVLWPAICFVYLLVGLIAMCFHPDAVLEIEVIYYISTISSAIVSVLLFWSAHKEKRVIPQSSKAGQ